MKRLLAIILSIMVMLSFAFPVAAVSSIAVKSIKLNNSKVTLKAGQSSVLKVVFTPANTTQKKLTYVTGNKKIATVDATGKITGVNAGTTTITVYSINKKIYAKCTVTVPAPLKQVTLKYYLPIGGYPDVKLVNDEINKYTMKKINAKVEIIGAWFDSYATKLQIADASNEEYDICWASSWLNYYVPNVNKGAYLGIDKLLDEYGQNIKKVVPAQYWKALKVNGVTYGIPNMQIVARVPVWNGPKELAEKYKFDFSKATKMEDFEPYLKAVLADNPKADNTVVNWNEFQYICGFEPLSGNVGAAFNYRTKGKIKVFNEYETPEFKHFIETKRRWNQEGLTNKTLIPQEEAGAYKTADGVYLIPLSLGATNKPTLLQEIELYQKFTPVLKNACEPLVTTNALTATVNCIGANSQNPERAMMFLDLLNSDPVLYNMAVYGIEGKHYNKVSTNRIEVVKDVKYSGIDWATGNVFNGYLFGSMANDIWEQTKAANANGKISPLLGFTPDLAKIGVQNTNCGNVVNEFLASLEAGIVDVDKAYNEMKTKLKAAGIDILIKELQRQVDKFTAK